MKCNCGDVMSVQAESLEAAKTDLKGKMNEAAIAKHMAEKHKPEDAVPSMADVHAQIDADLKQVEEEVAQ